MATGRKPIPTNVHVLHGTDRSDRINPDEPKPEPAIPECPDHLDAEAKREWERVTEALHALGVLADIDRSAIAAYCQLWGTVRRQNKWDRMGAFKACNLDANRLRQFSDLPTSVRLDSFASPPVSSPVWRLGVRGTYPPA